MAIHLANKTVTFPRGICEDLLVKVDKFVFPVDFIELDMEEDHQVPIILGRPFLNTAGAIVDIRDSRLTLRVAEESVIFGIDQAMKHSNCSDDTAFSVDVLEELLEGWKEDETSEHISTLEDDFDAERDLKELERLLEESKYEELIKSIEQETRRVNSNNSMSCYEKSRFEETFVLKLSSLLLEIDVFSVQRTQLELKTLPEHLEYAFLEEGEQKPVIIASNLTPIEKDQ